MRLVSSSPMYIRKSFLKSLDTSLSHPFGTEADGSFFR